jgi:hypothetical protein
MEHTLRTSYEKVEAAEKVARGHHYEGEVTEESFWKKAAASLPPHVQRRYGHLFEAAEQYEPVMEFIVDGCARGSRAIARLFSSGSRRRDVKRHGALSRKHA